MLQHVATGACLAAVDQTTSWPALAVDPTPPDGTYVDLIVSTTACNPSVPGVLWSMSSTTNAILRHAYTNKCLRLDAVPTAGNPTYAFLDSDCPSTDTSIRFDFRRNPTVTTAVQGFFRMTSTLTVRLGLDPAYPSGSGWDALFAYTVASSTAAGDAFRFVV